MEKPIKQAGPADHLANERTFLAWIRTSIALMGFGFVIVKFALFLRQLSLLFADKIDNPIKGNSAIFGVFMVALGGLVAVLAYFRYRQIEKLLNGNQYYPSKWLSLLVMLGIVIIGILLVGYLLPGI